ncbi:hypothetical protein SAMN02927930_00015 [Pseudidiomarina indica]|uniref:BREX-1 system adenine-specific DNA-methyltransferase PglX n=1 Tax=Pseudidiomarina indica TaxID=1159017 RepID=A0A1G6A0D7_9GAMM|nr:BREX-1 system adenine-specific DNA-methyltransferase PglX [Pseudidiomarina indica]SDB01706.1 hypothetical protein SAMN02927930_00015 [Pseudidiomarina indica]
MSEQTNTDMSKHFYRASAADFMKIPGSPVAYWLTEKWLEMFESTSAISEYSYASEGIKTGNNDRFLRYWFEVNWNDVGALNQENSKWVFHHKGGEYRKWAGNREFVIYWLNDGKAVREMPNSGIQGERLFRQDAAVWSDITSGGFSARLKNKEHLFDSACPAAAFIDGQSIEVLLGFLNSCVVKYLTPIINPTLHFKVGNFRALPYVRAHADVVNKLIDISLCDWNSAETSWDFTSLDISKNVSDDYSMIASAYDDFKKKGDATIQEMKQLEESNNRTLIELCGLQKDLIAEVPINEITINCNPYYRYGNKLRDIELENLYRCDTLKSLVSFSVGCMMGRYSLDKPGLIIASQGETIQDYLAQIPSPKFMPDDDAILPLTDQEWFADDVTNRFREFVKVVWGEETLQENLDFVAESLYLHAIKPKKGETSMEAIRRYLSTQFYKDHMKTYKKRPIYWLFSSGKQKAFECLVYLHRYNEGTLSRMRTEYVTPLMGKYESQIRHIEEQQTSASAVEKTKLDKELKDYQSKLNELREFDSKLKHYADMRISLDLDDGVKVNYGKFGDLLANVKDITGEKPNVT